MCRWSGGRPVCGLPPKNRPPIFGAGSAGEIRARRKKAEISSLTLRNRPSKLGELPRERRRTASGSWLFGVWLFFENSTGCLISQCQL